MTAGGRLPWPLVFQVTGVVAGAWLVVQTWQLWLLLFTALVVAAAILPAARWGERHRVPRSVTVLGVWVAVAAVLVLMGRLLWPALSHEAQQFVDNLPRLVDNVRGWLGGLEDWLAQWGGAVTAPKAENLQAVAATLLANTLRVTAGALGAAVGALIILIVATYVVVDGPSIGAALLALVPPAHRPTAAALAGPVLDRMGGYVRGQLLSSAFVGALIAVTLWVIGVRYALLIGAVAAVLNIVPFVGATVALVLGVLSALSESLGLALLTALLMWAAQAVEGKLLAPHFLGRATGLHPLAVLLALLAGARLAGLIGALVAVPLLAALWEIVRALRVERRE